MAVRIEIELSEEDARRLEQAFKDGKLNELGISSIEDFKATPVEQKKWVDPSLEKRGNLKSDNNGPTRP